MIDCKIIAVDFDGTLCENAWPLLGAPNMKLIKYLIEQQEAGAKIILWTCRVGRKLKEAVNYCKDYQLHFDRVNANVPEVVGEFGTESRKIFAHEYIDDRASKMFELPFRKHYAVPEDAYAGAIMPMSTMAACCVSNTTNSKYRQMAAQSCRDNVLTSEELVVNANTFLDSIKKSIEFKLEANINSNNIRR